MEMHRTREYRMGLMKAREMLRLHGADTAQEMLAKVRSELWGFPPEHPAGRMLRGELAFLHRQVKREKRKQELTFYKPQE